MCSAGDGFIRSGHVRKCHGCAEYVCAPLWESPRSLGFPKVCSFADSARVWRPHRDRTRTVHHATAVRREARQETARAGVVRPCAVEDARRRARGLGFVRQGGIAAVGPQAGLCRARRQGVEVARFMSLLSHYCLQAYALARSSCVVGGRVCVVLLLS